MTDSFELDCLNSNVNLIRKAVSMGAAAMLILSTLMLMMSGSEFYPPLLGGTPVSGTISVDTTWTLSGSPYWVVGNVTVNKSVTLTIEPGVDVKFNGKFKLIVEGSLYANGTWAQIINFTSNNTSPKPGDWERIQILSNGHCILDFCNISYSTGGIEFLSATKNKVVNSSICYIGYHGIYMDTSANLNQVINSTIYNSKFYGIDIYSSSSNTITNCTIANSSRGVLLNSASNNVISNCTIFDTSYGFSASWSSNKNTIANCVFATSAHGIGVSSSNSLLISQCYFSNCSEGINLYKSSNTTVQDSNFKNCGDLSAGSGVGILLNLCDNNKIMNCKLERNTHGIELTSSNNNTISYTRIVEGCIGLSLYDNSSHNLINNTRIVNQKCTSIPGVGIYFAKAHNNTIAGCEISYNSDTAFKKGGIHLNNSDNNTITNSLLCSNKEYGILFQKCKGNRVFHNDIIGNLIQALDDKNNSFNFTYPVGGNYWSDYKGPDNFHGPCQNLSGGDGIGDIPRPIPGGKANDSYPLVNPINAQTMSCTLKPGWNLISIPLIVSGPPEQILQSINGSYDLVQWYDSSEPINPWKTYQPGKPQYMNSLTTINNMQGLWLHTNTSGSLTLTVTGIVPMETSILLNPGWNLVGYPSSNTTMTIDDCFVGIPYDRIQGFNDSFQYRLQVLTGTDLLLPWRGYWVNINASYLWTVRW